MTVQNGYRLKKSEFDKLVQKTDASSKRAVKLIKKLLNGDCLYDELTINERKLLQSIDCIAIS